uniref:Zinc transporter 6-A-like n=1 Tax=Hirondellea gigas TaxID=1518452 RepID=A0A2P2I9X3_9CRUS
MLASQNKAVVGKAWQELLALCSTHRLHSIILFTTLLFTCFQFCYYKHSTCMALLSFNNLCVFNLLRVVSHMFGLWSDQQPVSSTYTYGLVRVRVLVVFSGLVLMLMLACWTVKVMVVVWLVGVEGELYYGCSSSGSAVLLGTEVLVLTAIISATGSGAALDAVIRATTAAASPLMTLLHRLAKSYLPPPLRWRLLDLISLLRRVWFGGSLCPVLVLALSCWLMLIAHTALAALMDTVLGMGSSAVVVWCDAVAAVCMLLLTATYLTQPFLVTTRTLMQGIHQSSSAVQRCLREASTIEGVLEIRQAQVWSLAPLCLHDTAALAAHSRSSEVLSGSVLVRLHRDARIEPVMLQLQHCLRHCLHHLTLQVYKDEWLQNSVAPLLPASNAVSNTSSGAHDKAVRSKSHDRRSEIYHAPSPVAPAPTDCKTSVSSNSLEAASVMRGSSASHSPHYVNINFPFVPSHISNLSTNVPTSAGLPCTTTTNNTGTVGAAVTPNLSLIPNTVASSVGSTIVSPSQTFNLNPSGLSANPLSYASASFKPNYGGIVDNFSTNNCSINPVPVAAYNMTMSTDNIYDETAGSSNKPFTQIHNHSSKNIYQTVETLNHMQTFRPAIPYVPASRQVISNVSSSSNSSTVSYTPTPPISSTVASGTASLITNIRSWPSDLNTDDHSYVNIDYSKQV